MLNIEVTSEPKLYNSPTLPYGTVKLKPIAIGDYPLPISKRNRGIATGYIRNKLVQVEFLTYECQLDQGRTSAKVKRLAALFLQARSSAFLIALFLGYMHKPLKNRFGLVFRASLGKEPSLTLRYISLYNAISQKRLIALNRRIGLTFALNRAISTLHAISWVYKSFYSKNVIFLYHIGKVSSCINSAEEGESKVFSLDFQNPRLFGFDAARPTNAISSQTREFRLSQLLYTHPERQGRLSAIFGALHDVYALRITLLEVGYQKPASRIDRRGRGFSNRRNKNEVRDKLLVVAREQLPHLTGKSYSQAVITCLDGSLVDGLKEGSEGLSLHQEFGTRVLIPLGRCTYT